jgi:hypothetical protein
MKHSPSSFSLVLQVGAIMCRDTSRGVGIFPYTSTCSSLADIPGVGSCCYFKKCSRNSDDCRWCWYYRGVSGDWFDNDSDEQASRRNREALRYSFCGQWHRLVIACGSSSWAGSRTYTYRKAIFSNIAQIVTSSYFSSVQVILSSQEAFSHKHNHLLTILELSLIQMLLSRFQNRWEGWFWLIFLSGVLIVVDHFSISVANS